MKTLIGAKTHFSLGESIIEPTALIDQAADAGYECVAIADTMNINSLVSVFGRAKKHNIKVIMGASLRVVDDLQWRKAKRGTPKNKPNPFFMPKLFVKNEEGLRDLMGLLTLAGDPDHFYEQAQVDLDELISVLSRGNIVCTSGDAHSVFSHARHTQILKKIVEAGALSDYVSEVVPINTSYYDTISRLALKWERENRPQGICAIVSRMTYNSEGDSSLRNTLNCIESRLKIDSMWRSDAPTDLHIQPFRSMVGELASQVARLYRRGEPWLASEVSGIARECIRNTEIFGDRFDYTWEKMPISLPDMSDDPFQALRQLCTQGWKARILESTLGYTVAPESYRVYMDRLKYELTTLKNMGFENYFLLVTDLVNWCKDSEILVGPGRGSVGGSLVAYLLGITDVDPIRFGLIFERFINPDRLDLPDIDLDFMSSRREEVITYLIDKYGKEHVAGIANYGVLGGASSLRAVASAHNLTEIEFGCSKQIPKEHGQPVDLLAAKEVVPDIEKFASAYPEIWRQSVGLQGVFRNYGRHAAGVIVAKDKIAHRAVINSRDENYSVNWDKRVVEDFGLVKLDVLGLQTLDLLFHAKRYAKEITGEDVEYTQIALDDQEVLDAFGRGETVGVFQFEGGGMRHLLKELAAADSMTFNEITAATALFRPGPLEAGLTEAYVQIRQGARLPEYIHPSMEPALAETYSVIVYQEQVMQIARDLAGFTMTEADKLRKAMGKKSPEEMAKMRDAFVDGCQSVSDISEEVSTELFNQIESFAGYAFNKSHSVEYTILSYWSMYMKIRYPAPFYAAALTILDEAKRLQIIKGAEAQGITIYPPDINISSDRFEIRELEPDKVALFAPFQMIKGLSEKASAAILLARSSLGRDFASKEEFILMVNRRTCNKRGQESLDKVGAFSRIEDQLGSLDSSRLKDQKILLPGLISSNVVADRSEKMTNAKRLKIEEILQRVSAAGADLEFLINQTRQKLDPDAPRKVCIHPMPHIGKSPDVFIIMDAPNWTEVVSGVIGKGEASSSLRNAIKASGLAMDQCYITALVKCGKDKGEDISNAMINAYSDFLHEEIDLINPPVIVALGSKAIRALLPDIKGGWEELAGQTHYSVALDATIFCGFNPAMIHFEPSRQELLNSILLQAKQNLGSSFD